MPEAVNVTVEFYGIPRLRAGRDRLDLCAPTVHEALILVEQACPGLTGIISADGLLEQHFLVSLNGRAFVRTTSQDLAPNDRLLLLSADAGG